MNLWEKDVHNHCNHHASPLRKKWSSIFSFWHKGPERSRLQNLYIENRYITHITQSLHVLVEKKCDENKFADLILLKQKLALV